MASCISSRQSSTPDAGIELSTDNLAPVELPVYIDKTAEVLNWMKSKSKEELKAIWKCRADISSGNCLAKAVF